MDLITRAAALIQERLDKFSDAATVAKLDDMAAIVDADEHHVLLGQADRLARIGYDAEADIVRAAINAEFDEFDENGSWTPATSTALKIAVTTACKEVLAAALTVSR